MGPKYSVRNISSVGSLLIVGAAGAGTVALVIVAARDLRLIVRRDDGEAVLQRARLLLDAELAQALDGGRDAGLRRVGEQQIADEGQVVFVIARDGRAPGQRPGRHLQQQWRRRAEHHVAEIPGRDRLHQTARQRRLAGNVSQSAKEKVAELQDFVRRFAANKSKARQATSRASPTSTRAPTGRVSRAAPPLTGALAALSFAAAFGGAAEAEAQAAAADDEDAPRLVFADWLEEHGDSDRAEFIRVQSARTFDEDKVMLEAQQRALGAEGGAASRLSFSIR